MPTPILMPALSPTMSEGNLARWLKKEGDTITPGEVIAEIETDKATMEVEAVDEGRLGRIVVREGTEGVPVNDVIALLLDEGEDTSALEGFSPGGAAGGEAAVASTPAEPASKAPVATPASPEADVQPAPPSPPAPMTNGSDRRVSASPLAARMAAQAGIDLARIQGSGPHGRIVKRDIERVLAEGLPAAAAPPSDSPPVPSSPPVAGPAPDSPAAQAAQGPALPPAERPSGGIEEIPLSMTRKVIARRLTEAKQTIPHFYVSTDVDLDPLLKLRGDINARPGVALKISVNDFVIKAAALALQELPAANVTFGGDRLYRYQDVDIAVAVAIPDGLITPIIRHADRKGVAAIAQEMLELAERARAGRLRPEEFQGGSFSISNLGMYGVRDFQAVINPPQAAILAVAAGEQRPVVRDGALRVATIMTVTLSVDHRAIDGALAADWLKVFKGLIESPLSMLV